MAKTVRLRIVCAVIAIALGCLWAFLPNGFRWLNDTRHADSHAASALESMRSMRSMKDMREIALPHLDFAEERIAEAARKHFGGIDSLFERSRSQTGPFAKSALGWGSKWRLVADATPFTRGDRHAEFLRAQFEGQVLRGEDLTKTIEQAVNAFLAEIRSVESKMLADLRVDVEDLAATNRLSLLDEDALRSHFDAAIECAMQVSGLDLQSNVGSQLVSIIVGEVLTQVAVRLGVSAGILGTGAASGWATLGIGILVGLVIDQIVSAVWNHWNDPTKNLEEELNYQLKVMQRMICYGDDRTKGLAQHFDEIAKTRAELRRTAIFQLLGVEENLRPEPNQEER